MNDDIPKRILFTYKTKKYYDLLILLWIELN